jgi:hypothetical protein
MCARNLHTHCRASFLLPVASACCILRRYRAMSWYGRKILTNHSRLTLDLNAVGSLTILHLLRGERLACLGSGLPRLMILSTSLNKLFCTCTARHVSALQPHSVPDSEKLAWT